MSTALALALPLPAFECAERLWRDVDVVSEPDLVSVPLSAALTRFSLTYANKSASDAAREVDEKAVDELLADMDIGAFAESGIDPPRCCMDCDENRVEVDGRLMASKPCD